MFWVNKKFWNTNIRVLNKIIIYIKEKLGLLEEDIDFNLTEIELLREDLDNLTETIRIMSDTLISLTTPKKRKSKSKKK